jgi:hypothetical protein
MSKKTTKEDLILNVNPLALKIINFKIVGDTPLILHKWSEKAKKQIKDKQNGIKVPREIRNPIEEFANSLYWLSNFPKEFTEKGIEDAINKGAEFGFPAIGLKLAMASALYRLKISKDKVSTLGYLYIEGHNESEFIKIDGIPTFREDMITVSNGGADLRYRGQFLQWSSNIKIKFVSNVISPELILNALNYAGFSVGLGEWRPEKKGQFGMFHVEIK